MRKVVVLVALSFAAVRPAVAAPVSGETAMKAVDTWLGRRVQLEARMGARAASVWSCQTNGASFHVVKVADGGFVVTSADTEIEPIVAFSESEDLVVSEENPLWVMLTKDLSSRQRQAVKLASAAKSANAVAIRRPADKWAALAGGTALLTGGELKSSQAAAGQSFLSDVRVAPLVESRWSQAQDSIYSNRGSPCYNYYTPNNFPCGCVATAGAQIMRYHRFPTSSVAPVSRNCQVMTGKDWIDDVYYYPVYAYAVYTTQGGVYAWDDMPLVPANGTTETQRKAIGKLTSDIGISCGIAYGESFSAAASYMLAPVLMGVFGYANALPVQYPGSCDAAVWKAAILPNLDAKLPVEVSLNGSLGGHSVIADGYGYSLSTLYVHFNMGWAGEGDAWYAPPAVEEFTSVDGFVCNVYPSGAANGVICSGRVLTADGKPVAGAEVAAQGSSGARTSCRTDAKGIYALILAAGTHTLNATKGGETSTVKVSLSANVGIRITDSGSYYMSPSPVVSNVFGQDITLSADTEPSAGIAESYGPFDPGVKMSLVIPELIGYTAKGLPSGVKLDKKTGAISGTPKKPTGDAGATVTFTKKDAETLTAQFVVGPIPTISVTLEGDTEKCKVTGGNKAYLVGKKVSLVAKGPKGTAFVGWFKDGEPWPSEETYLTAKISYVMTAENLDLVACFEKEKMSIDASSLEGAFFEAGAAVAQGEIVIDVETQSGLKSLKASKLPSGLKLAQDKKTGEWSVFGTPKKAGSSVVTLTATAKSGATETKAVDVVVGEAGASGGGLPVGSLPSWIVGTFEGYDHDLSSNYDWEGGWEDEWLIKTQVTVSPSGKVSVRRASCTISKATTGQIVSCDGTTCRIAFADDSEMTLQLARLEADGCEWGRVTCTWRHINEWNEHIESTLALWQVRWRDFAGSAVAPVFAKNTQTTISMEEWLINGETAANPSCHGGFLTLKYGDAGVLTASFSETSDGTATATSSAQMVPTELDKDGRLHLLATMILKPKNRVPFSLVLWLSVPAGAGQVAGNDVVVEDYLLCHD